MSYELPNAVLWAVFDDGRELKLTTDQRDQYRAFRLKDVNPDIESSAAKIHSMRAIAWAAAERLGEYAGSWEEWDQTVAWVVADAERPEEAVDPTPAAGAESSPP